MEGHGGEQERSRSGAPDGRPEGGREVRWSARRKEELVLRLLRGEGLDALARETGQAAGTISVWREDFLAAGREGLKSRPRPVEDRQLADASARSASWRSTTTSCAAWSRRWAATLGRRGAERRRTAGGPAGARLSRRRGVQVGGVRAAPPTQPSEPTGPGARRRPGPVGALPDAELLRAIHRGDRRVAVRRRGPRSACCG
jgi:hypothetical protein